MARAYADALGRSYNAISTRQAINAVMQWTDLSECQCTWLCATGTHKGWHTEMMACPFVFAGGTTEMPVRAVQRTGNRAHTAMPAVRGRSWSGKGICATPRTRQHLSRSDRHAGPGIVHEPGAWHGASAPSHGYGYFHHGVVGMPTRTVHQPHAAPNSRSRDSAAVTLAITQCWPSHTMKTGSPSLQPATDKSL